MTDRETRLRERIDQLADERDYWHDRFEKANRRRTYYRQQARLAGISARLWRDRYSILMRQQPKWAKRLAA